MTLVGADVLLYAYDSGSPYQEASKRWFEAELGSIDDLVTAALAEPWRLVTRDRRPSPCHSCRWLRSVRMTGRGADLAEGWHAFWCDHLPDQACCALTPGPPI